MTRIVESTARADAVSAWAVGVGVGLMTLMITWLLGNRVLGLVLDAPLGPSIAFIAAIVSGVTATVITGQRCARTITST